VEFAVRRISLSRRIELTEKVRELVLNREFLSAGDSADQLQATISDLMIRRLYLEWGLVSIKGLRIDGRRAGIGDVVDRAPEELVDEIVDTIKSELGLTDEERKNS
jgi:hypothetical protein